MSRPTRIYISGDSTAANYPAEQSPMAGWGQMLPELLQGEIAVFNEASCGRSSKSFLDEGRLNPIAESIQQGDYLFVQFGHNDQKQDAARHTDADTTYLDHLMQYIALARKSGATPVLFTSVARRHFNADGELVPTHGAYPEAMKRLAREQQVLLVDLEAKTEALYRALGPESSKKLFVWLEAGQHPNYPKGVQDNTHFNEYGAREVAGLAVAGLAEVCPALRPFMKSIQS
ncbi:rhamnogalacturonan acetylesterase [Paenibacillus sp. NPDC056579]|uniref:rhamnogalacturonan acetylesterase n=1 Tax=Paenibacillus sp. NPDC056579 TaxID=3345871 RepID=UPI0036BF626D